MKNVAPMAETELMPCYLIYASTHPTEGPMLFVEGREGVERALATQLVFGYDSIDALSDSHRKELTALMEQFDDPDEWSGCQFMWSFEDGGVCVVRLAPEAIAAWNRRASLSASQGVTPEMALEGATVLLEWAEGNPTARSGLPALAASIYSSMHEVQQSARVSQGAELQKKARQLASQIRKASRR